MKQLSYTQLEFLVISIINWVACSSFIVVLIIRSVGEFEEWNTNFIVESSRTSQEQFILSHKSLLKVLFCFLYFFLLTFDAFNTNGIGIYTEWKQI